LREEERRHAHSTGKPAGCPIYAEGDLGPSGSADGLIAAAAEMRYAGE
jgi:hypothetical protein